MELSELLTLIQFEVQKSYDFAGELAHRDSSGSVSHLQIAIESIELDLPLIVTGKSRRFDPKAGSIARLPGFAKAFKVPFSVDFASKSKAARIPSARFTGTVLDVKFISEKDAVDTKINESTIARMKIVVKPFLK